MRFKGWKRALALILVAFAIFAAVEASVCADDFGACCEESHCCGCVHVAISAPIVSILPILPSVSRTVVGFVSVPDWKSEPLLHPPIA
jgi:hypothetical protein